MRTRIYHHYQDLEEWHAGMWAIVRGIDRKKYIAAAATLMKNPAAFIAAMTKATEEWPRSCQHNLTADNTNRIAWLGHAGCCIATGSPEEATRAAWHTLLLPEQDAANAAALKVLMSWDSTHQRAVQIALFMEEDYA